MAGTDTAEGVRVQSGANTQTISVSEDERLTVGDVRARLGDVLNIAPTSIAVVGDTEVEDDRRLVSGETVEFIKRAGTKG